MKLLQVIVLTLFIVGAGPAWTAGIYFETCSKKTCTSTGAVLRHRSAVIPHAILSITDSNECPGVCAMIGMTDKSLHVFGSWLRVVCQVWGGQMCGWAGDVIGHDEAMELLKKSVNPARSVVPSEVVPSEVVPSEVVPSEVVPSEVAPPE